MTPQMTFDYNQGAAASFGPAPCSAFRCIVADPPWKLEMSDSRTMNGEVKRGKWADPKHNYVDIAGLQYPTMTVEEIAALQIPAADDAHLYIWTINRYIEETYDIVRAWGFEPSTMLYWLKQPMGLGLGGAFVPCVEPILFCRRGKLAVKRRCDRNWWGWPRGKHSQKPEEFQTVVESVSPGPYLELFARRKRPGWHVWGNEVASDVILTPNVKGEPPMTSDQQTPNPQPDAAAGHGLARPPGSALDRAKAMEAVNDAICELNRHIEICDFEEAASARRSRELLVARLIEMTREPNVEISDGER